MTSLQLSEIIIGRLQEGDAALNGYTWGSAEAKPSELHDEAVESVWELARRART